ncbi:hypothetical protein FOZ60_015578 [Perkinsus olseni]|uniref:C2H2-type domain-containing protein n=2 Tax=Perkinsus olseni TaxID=32597 RepID=A0A7J6N5S8_PEROL|nr:hypothetical protein FOZ60_015578 [Perkinsus olseni]
MLRYGNLDEQPIAPSEPLAGQGKSLSENYDKVVDYLRGQIIGKDQRITIPYDDSTRKIVYADYTASGRGLHCIEDFITHRVLPTYGNTHSIASATARQTTFYRSEAREKVRAYFNANHEDSVIFCGAGATGASNKFLEMLWKSRGFDQQGDQQDDERKFFREDRWGGCECTLCDVRLKNESVYRSHVKTVMHAEKLGNYKNYTEEEDEETSVPGSHFKLSGTVDSSVDNVFETELVELPLDHTTGTADVNALEEVLKEIVHFNESTATDTTAVPVVVLSACSNVTGAMLDIPTLSTLVHSYNGIACWDLAAASSKIKVDMNPVSHPQGYIDFAFVSPHKLLGGPGSSGLLLCKKKHQTNAVPAVCGGGVVFYVSPVAHSYIQNHEEREEAGTPDILGCIRAGAVYHLHSMLDHDMIAKTERRMATQLVERLSKCSKIHILGPQDRSQCAGIVSFNILYNEDPATKRGLYLHYNFVGAVLNDVFGVQGRGGCACAGPYAHSLLGINNDMAVRFENSLRTSGCEVIRPGFMRVGVHYSMTQEELDVLAGSILWVAENGWKLLGAYTFSTSTGEWHHQLDRRDRTRQWLSTDLGWSRVLGQDVGSIADLGERSTTACDDGIDSLINRADTIVDNAYSAGQVPFSAVKCPLLDPQLADLVWFALPTDCKWSLDGVSSPQPMLCTDPNVPLFKGGVQGDDAPARASESVFNSSIWSMTEEERKSMMKSRLSTQQEERQSKKREASTELVAPHVKLHPSGFPQVSITPVVSKKLRLLIGTAVRDFQMIGEGDKILVGLSGGKDSLTMLHLLLAMRKRSPVKFTIGAATVDPQTPEYSPEPLKRYMEALGVEYHFLSKPLIEMAKNSLDPKKPSLCSFCARMKRGMLYSCMREFGYTSLALGQHLDDLAESFVMSAFHNGTLRTMKANYFVQQGDLRVIRPLVYCREKQLAEFASENRLPVISDNCPACFAAPKERHRVKVLLSEQEFDYPRLFNSLLSTMKPLMAIKNAGKASDIAKGKISGDEKMATTKGSSSDEDTDQAAEECIMSCNIGGACPLPRKQK